MNWIKMNRDLVKGDVIRAKVGNKGHEHYGEFVYAICSGDGFGCCMGTSGNAIFVHHQSFDLDEVKSKKFLDSELKHGAGSERWERFWGIEILEEPNVIVKKI